MKREINLITDEFAFDPAGKLKKVLLAVWTLLILTVVAGMILSKSSEIKRVSAEMVSLQERITKLSAEEAELNQFIQKNGQPKGGSPVIQPIPWDQMLSKTGLLVPEGTWLKTFEGGTVLPAKDQPPVRKMKMTGFAYSNASITLLLSRLERLPLYSEIHLIYSEKGENADDRYVHFEITGKIN